MSVEPLQLDELIESGKHIEDVDDSSLIGTCSPSDETSEVRGVTSERSCAPSAKERARRSEEARLAFEASADKNLPIIYGENKIEVSGSDWRETYKILRDAGWPWRKAVYIAWCASPKKDRWPKTQDELATKILGLTSDRVFATWRMKETQIEDTIATLQAAPLWAHRADVIHALVDSASNSDHRSNPDRKLFLELTGDYIPKQKVEVSGMIGDEDDLSNIPEGELIKKSRQAKDSDAK